METSIVSVATNGIVPLSNFEIDLVSGGKSAIQKLWENIANWLDGLGSQPSTTAPIPATPEQIGDLQRDCRETGGNFSFSTGTAEAGINFRVVNVDSSVSWFNVQCISP